MQDTIIISVFASVFLGIIGYILGYQLIKFLKGTVKIIIPRRLYFFGENISGNIEIHAKKHIDVQMVEILLIAYKKEKTYTNSGTKTKNVEIFRQEQEISKVDSILPGNKRNIPFETRIPDVETLPKELQIMIGYEDILTSKVQSFYRGLHRSGKLHWNIRVNVSAKGIDLYKRESVEIKIPEKDANI